MQGRRKKKVTYENQSERSEGKWEMETGCVREDGVTQVQEADHQGIFMLALGSSPTNFSLEMKTIFFMK